MVPEFLRTGRFHHVGFTGSTRGGAQVYQAVAQAGFASCGLEMGGKDAALVLEDVDVQKVAESLVEGAFYNAGQSCCAVERIYVPRCLHNDFVEAFVEATHRLKLGDPREASTTLGPVVSREAARRIVEQCASAIAQGGRQVSSDAKFKLPELSDCYLPPRVLVGVDHSMSLMRDETFGPLIGIMPYEGDEEGLRLVNDSHYGLTASIWTTDQERAVALGKSLDVGTVYMNRCDAVDPDLPWVGAKASGLGFTLSHWGILNMTRPQSFNLRV
jgi:acyl-CoA reductase-like NAD-dependent aldehyde dehydrogenase